MTVSSSLNRKAYTGDGVTTSFSTSPVVFFDSDELDVYVVTTATGASTTLTENTHYTVSGGAGSTGAVSLAGGSSPYGAPSASQTLVIVRTLDLVQEFDPENNDGSDAENIETAFDKLTMMVQQNAAAVARTIRLSESDVSGIDTTLVASAAAGKYIRQNSGGTGLEFVDGAATSDTYVASGAGATSRTVTSKLSDIISVKDYGAGGQGATDDTSSIQAAVNYAVANGGGVVFFPPGLYQVSSALSITKGVVLQGSGMGIETGTGNYGGSCLRSTVAGGDVITVSSTGSVIVRDMAIDAPSVTKSANTAGIRVQGVSGSGSANQRSRIENVRITNMYDGIVTDYAMNFVVRGCHIQDYLNIGVYHKQTGGVDSGHNTIDSCVIWDLNVATSQANIRYDKGGDLRVVNNKLLGGTYGFRVSLDDGETGTVLLTGNSFEEHGTNDIRVAQATSGKNFGNLVIVGNQFSTVTPSTPQSNIAVVAGTPGGGATCWLKLVTIGGNVINNAHNVAVAAISVQDGEGITVFGNSVSGGGQANPTGIDVGGNAVAAKIVGNSVFDMPGGAYSDAAMRWKLPTTTLVFSSDTGGVAAGATAYLGQGQDTTTEAFVLFYIPYKCKLLNLHTHAHTAPVGAETFTYTVRVNGVDSALTCQVTGSDTDGQDRTHLVAVPSPAGPTTVARVSVKVVTSGGAAVAAHTVSLQVTEDD